ncbi:MAG: hypothetical protein ACKOXT_01630 [Actinomycetota bacterium]
MIAFRQAPGLVRFLVVVLLIESAVIFITFLALFLELISGNYQNLYAEIFLMVLALGATLWVAVIARQILARKRWARSASFFWQLLQAVVGAGAMAEEGNSRAVGFALVGLAAIGVGLLFNSKVIEATNE